MKGAGAGASRAELGQDATFPIRRPYEPRLLAQAGGRMRQVRPRRMGVDAPAKSTYPTGRSARPSGLSARSGTPGVRQQ